MTFDGIVKDMSDLTRLSDAKSRSISPENPTGEVGGGAKSDPQSGSAKAACRELGKGWKCNPYVVIAPEETCVLADLKGMGAITHIWMTPTGKWRDAIIRIYWDGGSAPSVECPVGDFFCMAWQKYARLNSSAVCVNPASAFNCYWTMPFRKGFRITITNIGNESVKYYYQIDYTLTKIPEDAAYFHAQFRRVGFMPYKEPYVILDGVEGKGHYVGTFLALGIHDNGWWGEGEIKFYIDDDKEYPTICGTGTEDYFCGSYDFEAQTHDCYECFCSPYAGLHQAIEPDKLYRTQMRFGMYRWHIPDPVRFDKKLKVTIQDLGWREGGRYLPRRDDIASVAFWYQTLPAAPFPPLPSKDELELI